MKETEHYKLTKDAPEDFYDVTKVGANMDKIDAALDGLETGKAGLDPQTGKVKPELLPPMNYDPTGSAAAVETKLGQHTGNKVNPHGVTAAQVGADLSGSAAAVDRKLTTHTGDAVKHITAAERTTWNAKETTAGAQVKADAARDAAKAASVPKERKVNDKVLSADIALTAGDVGALPTTGGSGGTYEFVKLNITSALTCDSEIEVDFCGNRLSGVNPPTTPTDAANKQYVDAQVAGAVPSAGLPITKGGTGATTAAGARANLSVPAVADLAVKRNNDIRTYPVKTGESVRAGDVVDVVGGKVTREELPIGSLAVGSTIKLNVDGLPTEFIVVHHGKPSSIYSSTFTGKTILLMKDCYESRQWHSGDVNAYDISAIHAYLNSTFFNLLDADVRSEVAQVKIPYRAGAGYGTTVTSGESGLSVKIWLPSGYELGWTSADSTYFPADGAKLDYFLSGGGTASSDRRIATLAGSAIGWWLRSPFCYYDFRSTCAWSVGFSGGNDRYECSVTRGIRPALALPDSFTGYTRAEIHVSQAIALTSGISGQSIDVIFDGTAELPGITAGTSITSPGVQGYSPQDGWLWVKPEWDAKPFVVGVYIGDSAATRKIVLGFRPKAVLVLRYGTSTDGSLQYNGGLAVEGSKLNKYEDIVTIANDGFTVYEKRPSSGTMVLTNYAGDSYHYIAFR